MKNKKKVYTKVYMKPLRARYVRASIGTDKKTGEPAFLPPRNKLAFQFMERENIGMQDTYCNRHKEELTPGELSAALGVSTMTISRWHARGCPYREACPNYTRKSASRPRYNRAEVKAWIKEQQRNSQAEERRIILENINSEKFDNDRSAIEAKTSLSATELADMLNAAGYLYGVPRREKARAWEGDNVSRIYFGKDYITIKDGVITNRNLHKVRACTACDDAMNAVKIILESQAEDLRSARTDAPTDPAQEWLAPIKQKLLEARKAGASMADMRKMLLTMHPNTKALAKAFANNILAGFAGESEEVTAAGSNDDSRRRKEPIEMPDGTKCYTESCERHEDNDTSLETSEKEKKKIVETKESIINRIKKTKIGEVLNNMFSKYLNRAPGEEPSNDKHVIAEVSQKTIDKVKELSGVDLTGYKFVIQASAYHHSYRKHRHLKEDDIFLIPEVAENWDNLQYQARKNDADRLAYRKTIDGVTYRLVAKIGARNKELLLYFTSLFGENLPNK